MRFPSAPYPTARHHPSIVVAAPCAGLAPVIPPARRDARSSVRKRRAIYEGPSFKRHMGDWHINVGTYLGVSASEEPARYIIFYPAHHGTSLRAKVRFDLYSPVTPVAAPCICNPHRASFSKMILVCGGLFLYKHRIHRPHGTFRVRCGWDVVEMF